jgi:hypothetical protein
VVALCLKEETVLCVLIRYVLCRFVSHRESRHRLFKNVIQFGLEDIGVEVRFTIESINVTFLSRADRLWGSCSLLSNGYREFFPGTYGDRTMKLIVRLYLVRKSKRGSVHPLPHSSSWVVDNEPRAGTVSGM